mgnify:CR=1 FL=1
MTVREAARLQTFDDDYEFVGSMGEQYKMIGNAVPPAFAKILAQAIAEIYINYCPDKVPDNFGKDKIQHYVREPRMVQLMLAFEKRRKKKHLPAMNTQGNKSTKKQTKLVKRIGSERSIKCHYKRRSANG